MEILDFAADLLTHRGGLLEKTGNGYEVILPPEVAREINMPEHARLFTPENTPEDSEGIMLTYESETFSNFDKILGVYGRYCAVAFPEIPVKLTSLEEKLNEKISFDNAVFRMEESGMQDVPYLLGYFKYTALADEKKTGIVAAVVNEESRSVRRLPNEETDFPERFADTPSLDESSDDKKSLLRGFQALSKGSEEMVKQDLHEFIRSINRRLNRDVERVSSYFETLSGELSSLLKTKESQESLKGKTQAVQTEFKWKMNDLLTKYALTIDVEPVALIRIKTRAPFFKILIKRRKEARSFFCHFNPILKKFDPLPCEACFHPEAPLSVCDIRLHIVCRKCFKRCGTCGRYSCGACHAGGCPKCSET